MSGGFQPRSNSGYKGKGKAVSKNGGEIATKLGSLKFKMPEGAETNYATVVYLSEYNDSGNTSIQVNLEALQALIESGATEGKKYLNLYAFPEFGSEATEIVLKTGRTKKSK